MTEIHTIDHTNGRPSDLHVGVVVAGWNRSITDRLLDGALNRLSSLSVGEVTVLRVPGSLELPVGARALARRGCDAVVALGVIVKGDTDHYSIVSTESSRGLTLVAHEEGIPVANGILAVHDISLALDRAQSGPSNKGDEAANAAVETALAIAGLKERTST
ncbi:MAG TPA: 6,7-dimethyl-8-ribityllumazine synthase [Acidimicrobiia bacterium]|nr:6,7-dimethyl-8-ribityllumazine synthase [Acidimicrobiia bacterium]